MKSRTHRLLSALLVGALLALAFNAGRWSRRDIFIRVDCASPAAARERMRTPFIPPALYADIGHDGTSI